MDFSTKAMIALTVPDPENYALPESEDSVPADELHITLGYLGEAADISEDERAAILDACQVLADTSEAPEALFPASTGIFPPNPESPELNAAGVPIAPVWAAPANPEIFNQLREDLLVHLSARGVAHFVDTSHPVFSPHVTLAYAPLDESPSLEHLPTPLPTRFGSLSLHFGEKVTRMEMGTPIEGPELPLTASVRSQLRHLSDSTETSEDYLTALYLRQRQVRGTPQQTRAQAALERVNCFVDPDYRSKSFTRVQTLTDRVRIEPNPGARMLTANRALALAGRSKAATPTEARELAHLTASLRTIIADGNSSTARSLRVKGQLRDRFGRWIEMGGGVRFKVRVPGAPGGGNWYHGTVEGFDMAGSKVNVRLEDGRLVAIGNEKIEQPKAILGMKIGDAIKKAKSFIPKSLNRTNDAPEYESKPETPVSDAEQADLDAKAIAALENLYGASAFAATKDPTGGNLVRLAIDVSQNEDYKAAKDSGATEFEAIGTIAPFKETPFPVQIADISAVRDAYSARLTKALPSSEQLDEMEEADRKKRIQSAQGAAIGTLSGMYNDRYDENSVDLRKAPSVGTEADLDAAEVTENPEPPAIVSDQEVVDAVNDSFNELAARVPDSSSLSGARDRIKTSLDSANERFLAGTDDAETYAKNLDSIKEYADAQEPGFVPSSATKSPEQEAFGAFAEDIDDVHATIGGTDDIDAVKSALAGVEGLINSASEDEDGEIAWTDEQSGLLNDVVSITDGIKAGNYLNDTNKLADELTNLGETVQQSRDDGYANMDTVDEASFNEAMKDLGESIAPLNTPVVTDEPTDKRALKYRTKQVDQMSKRDLAREMAQSVLDSPGGYKGDTSTLDETNPEHKKLVDAWARTGTEHLKQSVIGVRAKKREEVPTDGPSEAVPEASGTPDVDPSEVPGTEDNPSLDPDAVPEGIDDPASYNEAPADADEATKTVYEQVEALQEAVFDMALTDSEEFNNLTDDQLDELFNYEAQLEAWHGDYDFADEETKLELSQALIESAFSLANALDGDENHDSAKVEDIRNAAKAITPPEASERGPVADEFDPAKPVSGPSGPSLADFTTIYDELTSLQGDVQEDSGEDDLIGAAGNSVAQVGKEIQQGKLTPEEGAEILGAVAVDVNNFFEENPDFAEMDVADDLDAIMGDVANIQAELAKGNFNYDDAPEDVPATPEAEERVAPTPATHVSPEFMDPEQYDDAMLAQTASTFLAESGFDDPVTNEALKSADNLAAMLEDPDTDQDDLADAFRILATDVQLASTDSAMDKTLAQDMKALAKALNVRGDNLAGDEPPGDADFDEFPGLDEDPFFKTIQSIIDSSFVDAPEPELAEELLPDKALDYNKSLEEMLNQLKVDNLAAIDAATWKEEKEEKVEDLLNAANLYNDELSGEYSAFDDSESFVEGEKVRVEKLISDLETVPSDLYGPDPVDTSANDPVGDAKISAIIDELNGSDGFVQKILADGLQTKLNNGEQITPKDLADVQQFLGSMQDSDNTSPVEKADYEIASDALDAEPEAPAAPEPVEAVEEPAEAPEAPVAEDLAEPTEEEMPATPEEALAAWNSSLVDYLNSPAYTGASAGSAMVHGSVHTALNQKQIDNILSISEMPTLVSSDSKKLVAALEKHIDGTISDDELIQEIGSIGENYSYFSKIAGRLRGAQSGIQVNKPALVPVLRPKTEFYGDPEDLDATDFYMASPEVVQATLNKILEQSLAGADLQSLLDNVEKVGTDDALISEHIADAKGSIADALGSFGAGDAEQMVGRMRSALDSFDQAIELRKKVHKNDKLIRRLRARRRALDEMLAAFENRWPDKIDGGNKQDKHGGFIIDNGFSMEDKNGDLVYPGDIIERTYGSAKGQLALTVATKNVNGVPRALVQLDDHPDVYHNGLGNKSFVVKAVGPWNPLFSDPSYTGPRVGDDSVGGSFGDLKTIQGIYGDNQIKKGKGAAAPAAPAASAPVTAVGGHEVADIVTFVPEGETTPLNGEIINFDSVGTEYEAATVETPNGDLHLVPINNINASEPPTPAQPVSPMVQKTLDYQEEIFETSNKDALEDIAERVTAEGIDGLGVYGYNQTMMKLSNKYAALNDGASIAQYLDNKKAINDQLDSTPQKPIGIDLKEEGDIVEQLGELPEGSTVITESLVSGQDYMTWTKTSYGSWKNTVGDDMSSTFFEGEQYVVLGYKAPSPYDETPLAEWEKELLGMNDAVDEAENDPDNLKGNPDAQEILENLPVGARIELKDLESSGVWTKKRDGNWGASGGGSASSGFIAEWEDLISFKVKDYPISTTPSEPSVFVPLPKGERGLDGDMWVKVNGSNKWGRYGAAGIAVLATDENGVRKVLLGKRGDRDEWYLPGGALDQLESPLQGGTREFIEEANEGGSIAENLTMISENTNVIGEIEGTNGETWDYTTIVAEHPGIVDVTVPDSSNSYELGEYQWVDADQLAELDQSGVLHKAMSGGAFAKLIGFEEGDAPAITGGSSEPVDLANPTYDMTGWKKIKNAGGSNDAVVFEDANGQRYYAKPAQSNDHAQNEILASYLYEHLGVNASQARLGMMDSMTYIVSPEVVGDQAGFSKNQNNPEFIAKIQENFAIDAWLSNYDVIGNNTDNIIADAEGNPVRVDSGAALMYRGTGGLKGWWGSDPTEINDMRQGSSKSGSFNRAAKVFGGMSDAQVAESVKKLLDISPKEIQEIVNSTGLSDFKKAALAEILVMRRHKMLGYFNIVDSPSNKGLATDNQITKIANAVAVTKTPASYEVGQKVKHKTTGETWTISSVMNYGTLSAKNDAGDHILFGYGDVASIEDPIHEGGEIFKFSKDGHNFMEGETVWAYVALDNSWTEATITDDPFVDDGFTKAVIVKTAEGGYDWQMDVAAIYTVAQHDAVVATDSLATQVATPKTGPAPTVLTLGTDFVDLPTGSVPLKQRTFANDFTLVLVQNEDGTLSMFSNKGDVSDTKSNSIDSYKLEAGWIDYNIAAATVSAPAVEEPAGTAKVIDLGPGYDTPPVGSFPMYKHALSNAIVVMHPDTEYHVYFPTGESNKSYLEKNAYKQGVNWIDVPEGTYDTGSTVDVPAAPKQLDLGGEYEKPPLGSKVLFKQVGSIEDTNGINIVEHPDGSVVSYWKQGNTSLPGMSVPYYEQSENWVTVPDAEQPYAADADAQQIDLGEDYAKPPLGSKTMFYREDIKGYVVKHPNGTNHLYYNTGEFYAGFPDSVYNESETWKNVSGDPVPVAAAPTVADVPIENADGPLSSKGVPVAKGDMVRIIKYAKQGVTEGRVRMVNAQGKVIIDLLNPDGTSVLTDKGTQARSIVSASSLVHQDVAPTVTAADLNQDGLPAGLIFGAPDKDSPYYGQPKPEAPTPPAALAGSAVDADWIAKADEMYMARKSGKYPDQPAKSVQQSSYWSTYYAKVQQGSETDLKWLLDNDYIDQALFDSAKAQFVEFSAKHAAHTADYSKKYDEYSDEFTAWKSAQGGASVVPLHPNDPTVAKWSHSAAFTNMNSLFSNQKVSPSASSGASNQKGGGWQEYLRKVAQTVGLKKADIAAQPDVSPHSMDTWSSLASEGGLSTNEGVKKPFKAIMTRRFWQFSDANGIPFSQNADISSMKGTIQKDFGAMEFTPGSWDDGGKHGYASSGYDVVVDLVVPAGIKGVWTGDGGWGYSGKTGEMGFIAESGLAMYIWDTEVINETRSATTGYNHTFTRKVTASLIPTELYPYMEYFEGNPDSHSVILPEEAQKIINQYKKPESLIEGETYTSPYDEDGNSIGGGQ